MFAYRGDKLLAHVPKYDSIGMLGSQKGEWERKIEPGIHCLRMHQLNYSCDGGSR